MSNDRNNVKNESGSEKDHKEKTAGLISEITNDSSVHKRLIGKLEEKTGTNIIWYVCLFGHPSGRIRDGDSTIIEHILRSTDLSKYPNTLDLYTHSLGGDANSAERIVHTCRSFAKYFRVVVPKTAMSAGSLLAMGADEIVMSDTSELGPIDPQMTPKTKKGSGASMPAIAFIDAYTDLITQTQKAIDDKKSPRPYLILLKKIDPSWLQMCIKARNLTRQIATNFLSTYMLKNVEKKAIENIVNKFLVEGEEFTHGKIVRADKAKELGLNVKKEPKESPMWCLVWEILLRCESYLRSNTLVKYILSRSNGINVRHKEEMA
jgi:ATP-dependent protease ClpP protease subunit